MKLGQGFFVLSPAMVEYTYIIIGIGGLLIPFTEYLHPYRQCLRIISIGLCIIPEAKET